MVLDDSSFICKTSSMSYFVTIKLLRMNNPYIGLAECSCTSCSFVLALSKINKKTLNDDSLESLGRNCALLSGSYHRGSDENILIFFISHLKWDAICCAVWRDTTPDIAYNGAITVKVLKIRAGLNEEWAGWWENCRGVWKEGILNSQEVIFSLREGELCSITGWTQCFS